jgi:hypothetical protein
LCRAFHHLTALIFLRLNLLIVLVVAQIRDELKQKGVTLDDRTRVWQSIDGRRGMIGGGSMPSGGGMGGGGMVPTDRTCHSTPVAFTSPQFSNMPPADTTT